MKKEKEDDGQQATISSFFKPSQTISRPGTSSTANTSAKAKKQVESITLGSSDGSDSDNDNQQPKSKKLKSSHPTTAATSSHFSAKPTPRPSISSLILTTGNNQASASASVSKKTAAKRVSQWRFDPSSATPTLVTTAQHALHKAFSSKLLSTSRKQGTRSLAYLQANHYLAPAERDSGSAGSGMEVDSDEEEEEEESEDDVKGKGKGKAVAGTQSGKKSVKYTPLELQVIELKKANPGVLLMIENGYKYAFFDEDAQIASRTLGIACFPKKNMLTASIPTHRLNIHIKKLINSGYKVGVVTQQETAALKKSSTNKSGPFTRALTSVFTSSTFIDELDVDDSVTGGSNPSTLVCIVEQVGKGGKEEKTKLGLIGVMPSTGEIVYDDFEDGHMRSELETRMLHLQPGELILPKSLTKPTEGMLSYLTNQNPGTEGVFCRIERITKKFTADTAFSFVSEFYADAKKAKAKRKEKVGEIVIDDDDEEEDGMAKILDTLPKTSIMALAFLIKHLKAFNLDTVFLHTHSFAHFSSRSVMNLNGNTLANLEILRNDTDYKERGSLLSILDHCKTPFGRRLLRRWVSRPLVSLPAVNERLDAISEILEGNNEIITKLGETIKKLPDLERGLIRIHFGRANPGELLKVLETLSRISNAFSQRDVKQNEVQSVLLQRVVSSLPQIKDVVDEFLGEIDGGKAKEGKKEDMFIGGQGEAFDKVQGVKDRLEGVEASLQDELTKCRKILKLSKLDFVQVSQEEYLIPVPVTLKNSVPDNWLRVNATKTVQRFRSLGVQKQLAELEQCRELLAAEADKAFKEYLKRVAEHYEAFRAVISQIAIADCLFSLAIVATLPNYCRPDFVAEAGTLTIVGGRHPMVETILTAPFVPNDVVIGEDTYRQLILTGLNMGGKSSLSRSIALIALMAQIGSYVPADRCTSSIFDGIYTRMGASDDLARGRSTFMVELSETSDILKLATPRSLVILDELGRGTSTNDGQAIAGAVLEHIVDKINCVTIFVTHFPDLAEIAKKFPQSVSVAHMSCLETPSTTSGFLNITFLYKLVPGLASSSHGIHVARLAALPDKVLQVAKTKAEALEKEMKERKLRKIRQRMEELLKALAGAGTGEEALRIADGISV